jgi:hypothetical protein
MPLANVIALVNAATPWRSGRRLHPGRDHRGVPGQERRGCLFPERPQVLQYHRDAGDRPATILALFNLNSNGITGILSGVAGYVLGGLNSAKAATPAPGKPASSPAGAEAAAKDPGTPGAA